MYAYPHASHLQLQVPFLHFTNVTVVAPGSLPSREGCYYGNKIESFVPLSYCYTDKEYKQLNLQGKASVVDAKIDKIDRRNNTVHLSNDATLQYDYLILTDGMQDKLFSKLISNYKGIKGLFELRAEKSMKRLKEHLANDKAREQPIVVFGTSLGIYSAIQGSSTSQNSPYQAHFPLASREIKFIFSHLQTLQLHPAFQITQW